MDPTTAQFVRYRERADVDALGAVFDALAPRLLALALHACGNAADAEDALQATFVVAMQKAHTFDARQPVGGWLAGILAGEASNLRRREQRRRAPPAGSGAAAASANAIERASAGGDGDPVAAGERAELIARLRTHVEALPIEQRQVLLLQLQYGLAPAAIAEVLGVPPGTVRMRLHRGLAALRAVLPVGLLATFAGVLPARGIAAVRAAVLRECEALAAAAGAGAGAGGGSFGFAVSGAAAGGLLVKKLLAAVVIALMFALGAWSFVFAAPDAAPLHLPAAASAVTVAGTVLGDGAPRPPAIAPVAERSAAVLAAAADATGALGVTVHGGVPARVSRSEDLLCSSGCVTPVNDALIEVWRGADAPNALGAEVRTARTDEHGRAVVVDLAPGEWHVALLAGGLRHGQKTVAVSAGAAAVFGTASLPPRPPSANVAEFHLGIRAVRGSVVDADGAPVADAEVWAGVATPSGDPGRQQRRAGRCDGGGGFAVVTLPGELLLGARKTGHAPSWSHPLDQQGDGAVVLRLGQRGSTGAATAMLTAPSGTALPPATVCVRWLATDSRRDRDGALLAPPIAVVARDIGGGRFVAADLEPGIHEVIAQWPGARASAVVQVVAGAEATAAFELTPGVEVRGRLRDANGALLAGLHVTLARDGGGAGTVITDAGGGFRFLGVAPGAVALAATRRASRATCEARLVVPSDRDLEHDLVLAEPPPLRGRVLDHAGKPLHGLRVTARQGAVARSEVTDGDGGFVLWRVEPGPATLAVTRETWPSLETTLHTLAVERIDPAHAVELVLPAAATATGAVVGRIVDARGEPVGGAVVEVCGSHPQWFPNGDAHGRFRLDEVAVGRASIQMCADGFRARRIDVDVAAASTHDIGNVVLERAGQLRVRFLRPDGTAWRERPPLPELFAADAPPLDAGEGRDREVVDGAVLIHGLAPRRYVVRGPQDDELLIEPQEVDVRSGAVAELVLTTAIGRRWSLRVCDAERIRSLERAEIVVRRALPAAKPRDAVAGVIARATIRPARDALRASLVLPCGELVAEVATATGVTHRARLHVRDRWPHGGSTDLLPVPAAAK